MNFAKKKNFFRPVFSSFIKTQNLNVARLTDKLAPEYLLQFKWYDSSKQSSRNLLWGESDSQARFVIGNSVNLNQIAHY